MLEKNYVKALKIPILVVAIDLAITATYHCIRANNLQRYFSGRDPDALKLVAILSIFPVALNLLGYLIMGFIGWWIEYKYKLGLKRMLLICGGIGCLHAIAYILMMRYFYQDLIINNMNFSNLVNLGNIKNRDYFLNNVIYKSFKIFMGYLALGIFGWYIAKTSKKSIETK